MSTMSTTTAQANGMNQQVDQLGELIELECVIERGLQTFVEVGTALLRIKTGKLYRHYRHEGRPVETFEDYCLYRWDWTRQAGYQYIAAAEVAQNVKTTLHSNAELSKSQAVELSPLPAEQQREVVAAIEGGKGLKNTRVRELKQIVTAVKAGTAPKAAAMVEYRFVDTHKIAIPQYPPLQRVTVQLAPPDETPLNVQVQILDPEPASPALTPKPKRVIAIENRLKKELAKVWKKIARESWPDDWHLQSASIKPADSYPFGPEVTIEWKHKP